MNKKKNVYNILFSTVLIVGLLFAGIREVHAADTSSDNSSQSGGEEQGQAPEEEIVYTVKKASEKVLMMPGETRMIKTSISPTATYTSSNTKVVAVSGAGQVQAKKPGTAKITEIDGTVKTIYTVKVHETVDIIVFAGQSNMAGAGGNYKLAPVPAYGTAYEFDVSTNTKKCMLLKEPFGEGVNRVNDLENKNVISTRGTIASAFSINYYKKTKTPVVGLACFWGGSSTNTWLNRGLVKTTQKNIKSAKKYLKKKNVEVRHIYMVWFQGESDAEQGLSASKYISRMNKIYKKVKSVGVEKVFVITIGEDTGHPDRNDTIISAQKKLCRKYNAFIMASQTAPKLYESRSSYYSDTVHFNQYALNKIGYEAGKVAGNYAKKHSKK